MKKLVLTLVALLAIGGSIFAQTGFGGGGLPVVQCPWENFNYNFFESNAQLVAFVQIDGVYVEATDNFDDLDIAAYVGDDCRGHEFMADYTQEWGDPYPVTEPMIYYTNPNEVLSFKMFNHETGMLYEDFEVFVMGTGEPITIHTGENHSMIWDGYYDEGIVINFITPPTPWAIEWDEVPTAQTNVLINNPVIIPSGYVAYANQITIGPGGQLFIEEGGQLYHNDDVAVTMMLDYTASGAKDDEYGIYRLIASPITPYVTVSSTGLVPESTDINYQYVDLYYFDQSRSADDANGANGVWINYKDPNNGFANFEFNKGYLYANGQNALGLFAGQTVPTSGVDVYVDLDYTDGNNCAGWNLVGNPFTCNSYITNGTTAVPYYVLNTAGTELNVTPMTDALAPMRGAFVQATAAGQRAYFTTTQPSRGASLGITLNQGRGMIDNAYINFDGGNTLEKFQLNPNHTKIYMPINGKDYAVANAEGQMGEMPVSFKAEHNGTYTLGFNTEDAEFTYLRLIDNMTGVETDLLATPSYTFTAKSSDYASRFKLVYATGSSANNDSFGFINSAGNLSIYGIEGTATLQVMDVMGHIISSETFSGSYEKQLNVASGVYMLRLINGNDVKVQKVIVK